MSPLGPARRPAGERCCSSGCGRRRSAAGGGPRRGARRDGFVLPKFSLAAGPDYLAAVTEADEKSEHPLYAMPVLETSTVLYRESREAELVGIRELLDRHRDRVLAVRIGATDLCAAYGIRRDRGPAPSTTSGGRRRPDRRRRQPSRPQRRHRLRRHRAGLGVLRQPSGSSSRSCGSRRSTSDDAAGLRAELIARDLDGLIREVMLDRANGLTGKTGDPPRARRGGARAVGGVRTRSTSTRCDVLAPEAAAGGVRRSAYGNKMNESKPHPPGRAARCCAPRVFGVAAEGVSFVDLLGASRQRWAAVPVARVPCTDASGGSGVRVARSADRGRPLAAPWSSSRCGATRGVRTCWCRPCWASTSRPTPVVHAPGAARRAGRGALAGRPPGRCRSTAASAGRAAAGRPRPWPRRYGASRTAGARCSGTPRRRPALGHCVAEALGGVDYLHSTRRSVAGRRRGGPGSRRSTVPPHGHLLLPADPGAARRRGAVVLVDDELSTGRTALNTIAALHRLAPRARYVHRGARRPARDADRAHGRRPRLGCASTSSSLARGAVELARRTSLEQARRARGRIARTPRASRAVPARTARHARGRASRPGWPTDCPGGRPARLPGRARPRRGARRRRGRRPERSGRRPRGRAGLVLGTEELMYAPLRIALGLGRTRRSRCGSPSTTRSPVLAVDEPGLPDPPAGCLPRPRTGRGPGTARRLQRRSRPFDDIVLVVDRAGADTAGAAQRRC